MKVTREMLQRYGFRQEVEQNLTLRVFHERYAEGSFGYCPRCKLEVEEALPTTEAVYRHNKSKDGTEPEKVVVVDNRKFRLEGLWPKCPDCQSFVVPKGLYTGCTNALITGTLSVNQPNWAPKNVMVSATAILSPQDSIRIAAKQYGWEALNQLCYDIGGVCAYADEARLREPVYRWWNNCGNDVIKVIMQKYGSKTFRRIGSQIATGRALKMLCHDPELYYGLGLDSSFSASERRVLVD